MNVLKQVLLVEDNPGDARLLREMLNEQDSFNTEPTHVTCLRDAEQHLATCRVDITLLDLGLIDAQGLDAVRRAHAAAPRVPIVVLTGRDDESLAAQALQEGAQDYLIKGQIETRGLLRGLRYEIERNVMEEVLFAERERAQVTLKSIGDSVICMDSSKRITFLNAAAEKITGWLLCEAAGRPMSEILRILDTARPDASQIRTQTTARDEQAINLPAHCVLVHRSGIFIPIDHNASTIHDREGRAVGTVIVFRDVSAARAMAVEMAHTAEHDFLTMLPNRMLLNDRIGQAIALAQRHNVQAAVLFLDLDGFKQINDSLGHLIGDKLLISVAKRLLDCVRSSDTVSRLGGDEFVVLVSEIEKLEDAATAAQRLLAAVSEVHPIDQNELRVTTSIGLSIYPDDGKDAETLIKNADTAMYQAKQNGRQGYRYFKPAENIRVPAEQG